MQNGLRRVTVSLTQIFVFFCLVKVRRKIYIYICIYI
jgi:hypothetical protein